jgi:hypothetical protein
MVFVNILDGSYLEISAVLQDLTFLNTGLKKGELITEQREMLLLN